MIDPEDFFDYLILEGAVVPEGIDPATGDMLYSFTDKLKQINENMFNQAMDTFHNDVMQLWQLGFLSMDLMSDNPLVRVTEKVFDEDAISALNIDLQRTLQEILRMMKR